MQRKTFLGTMLVLLFALTIAMKPTSAVDTLAPSDFKKESFSKTLDFLDFVRNYTTVPPNLHAYLYQTYINVGGFQLYYSGLINITAGNLTLTLPVQSFIEHYKTPKGKDVLTSSSFLMLLAFNETPTSRFTDSPDINDILYASFTLGWDMDSITGSTGKPNLNSTTIVTPLTSSADKTEWNWGMKYTNLAALWWYIDINPLHPGLKILLPLALTTYEELAFKYKLIINQAEHTAKVEASYEIGRMTNLWLPFSSEFKNSTGTYSTQTGAKTGNETIYQYIDNQHIKMSIVLFQNSLVLDHRTKSINEANSANVTDAEQDVSNGAIATETEDNEKIFEANFGTKQTYTLYNSTSEQTQGPYNAVTRTVPRLGYAKNPLFSMHVALLKYVPLIVQHIAPNMFNTAKDRMLNMTYADYFYVTSYPEYSGFKVTHDPTYIAYIAPATTGVTPPNLFGIMLIGIIIVVIVAAAALLLRRRGPKTQAVQTPQPPATN